MGACHQQLAYIGDASLTVPLHAEGCEWVGKVHAESFDITSVGNFTLLV